MTTDETRRHAEEQLPVYWDARVWRIGELDLAAQTALLTRPIGETVRGVPFSQLLTMQQQEVLDLAAEVLRQGPPIDPTP